MTVQAVEYKGAQITHLYKTDTPVTTTCAVDHNGKLSYTGPFCIDHLQHSYRYGEEIHLIVYQQQEPTYQLRQATSRDWHRVETHMRKQDAIEMAKAILAYFQQPQV